LFTFWQLSNSFFNPDLFFVWQYLWNKFYKPAEQKFDIQKIRGTNRTNYIYFMNKLYELCSYNSFSMYNFFVRICSISICRTKYTTFIKNMNKKEYSNIVKGDLVVKKLSAKIQWCNKNFIWMLNVILRNVFKFHTFCM
jgi:hypothetical protein